MHMGSHEDLEDNQTGEKQHLMEKNQNTIGNKEGVLQKEDVL